MTPLILSLPFELRLQIWEFVLGPTRVIPCKCPSKPGLCRFNHPGGCCESFDVYKIFDNRILRVCRQTHDEVRGVLANAPKRFDLCNGLCLESFFLSIGTRDRHWIKRVRVNLYIGEVLAENFEGQTGQELLRIGEASCGAFVCSALKYQGVGSLVGVTSVGAIRQDTMSRRILSVDLTLRRN